MFLDFQETPPIILICNKKKKSLSCQINCFLVGFYCFFSFIIYSTPQKLEILTTFRVAFPIVASLLGALNKPIVNLSNRAAFP